MLVWVCIESGLALFFLLMLNGGWTDLVADVYVEVAGATASHLQVLLFWPGIRPVQWNPQWSTTQESERLVVCLHWVLKSRVHNLHSKIQVFHVSGLFFHGGFHHVHKWSSTFHYRLWRIVTFVTFCQFHTTGLCTVDSCAWKLWPVIVVGVKVLIVNSFKLCRGPFHGYVCSHCASLMTHCTDNYGFVDMHKTVTYNKLCVVQLQQFWLPTVTAHVILWHCGKGAPQ